MSSIDSIDVDELEVRVRRRLALVDARRTDSAPGNARARSEDARSGKGTASLERRLPSDGGVVAQKAATYDTEKPPFPWFMGIARNKILKWYSTNKQKHSYRT